MKVRKYIVEQGEKTDGLRASKLREFDLEEYAIKKYLNSVKSNIDVQAPSKPGLSPQLLYIDSSQTQSIHKITLLINTLIEYEERIMDCLEQASSINTLLLKRENHRLVYTILKNLNKEQFDSIANKLSLLQNLAAGIVFFSKNTSPLSMHTKATLEITAEGLMQVAQALWLECKSRGYFTHQESKTDICSTTQIDTHNRKTIQLFIYLSEKRCIHNTRRPPLSYRKNSLNNKQALQKIAFCTS